MVSILRSFLMGFQGFARLQTPTVVNSSAEAENDDPNNLSVRDNMQAEELVVHNDAISTDENENNGCEKDEEECRREANTFS